MERTPCRPIGGVMHEVGRCFLQQAGPCIDITACGFVGHGRQCRNTHGAFSGEDDADERIGD